MANQFEMQITKILDEQGRDQQKLLSILLDIQKASGKNYISEEAAEIVSREMGIPLVKLYDILTFYAMLETSPGAASSLRSATMPPATSPNPTGLPSSFARSWGSTSARPQRTACLPFNTCPVSAPVTSAR